LQASQREGHLQAGSHLGSASFFGLPSGDGDEGALVGKRPCYLLEARGASFARRDA
jgi:hypothetical protein